MLILISTSTEPWPTKAVFWTRHLELELVSLELTLISWEAHGKYLAVSYKHPKDNWEWALERNWTWSFDCRANLVGWDSDPLVYVAMSHKSTMFNRKNPNIWIFQQADMLVHHGDRHFSDHTYLALYPLRWVVLLSKQAVIVRCRQGTARDVARHIAENGRYQLDQLVFVSYWMLSWYPICTKQW